MRRIPGKQHPSVAETVEPPAGELVDRDPFELEFRVRAEHGFQARQNALGLARRNKVFIVNRADEFVRIKEGNLSAVLLVVGGAILLYNRLVGGNRTGSSTAFDNFFLIVVILVIATGVLTEVGNKRLREFLSEVPAELFKTPLKAADVPRLFTTETFCKVVIRAQRAATA